MRIFLVGILCTRVKILRIEGSRLVRMVMLEALGVRGMVRWVENVKRSMGDIGWMGVGVEELGRLSV